MRDLLKKYSLLQIIQLLYFYMRTKLLFSKARLIRFPIDVRGKKHIEISDGFTTGRGCRIEAYPISKNGKVLRIGKNVQINDYVHITAMNDVQIGDNVLMASKIYISDCLHGSYKGDNNDSSPLINPIDRRYSFSKVIIKKNVWIGEFVSILPSVEIGEGAIIGANTVVTKDIPPYTIAVGNPAKVIKRYNFKNDAWENEK